MNNQELINRLVKLQFLTIRWVERHTNLKCPTHRHAERILTGNKYTCTYLEAINNLKANIIKHCSSSEYITREMVNLLQDIKESNIKDFRTGVEPKIKFTKEERELDTHRVKRTFFMIGEMVDIKYMAKELGLTESAIKQACQQERLLNTKKIGNNWTVHIPECRAYWNIPEVDNRFIFKDWVY